MTADLAERVARAIAPKAWHWYGRIGDNLAQENRRKASLVHARAAIAETLRAMMEPSTAMLRASIVGPRDWLTDGMKESARRMVIQAAVRAFAGFFLAAAM